MPAGMELHNVCDDRILALVCKEEHKLRNFNSAVVDPFPVKIPVLKGESKIDQEFST